MNRAKLKEKAKASLQGKFPDAITLIIIMGAVPFAIGFVIGIVSGILNIDDEITDLISNIASFIINGCLAFGYSSYFLKISRNETVTYHELFSKISLFIPYILISFLTGLFVLLWSFLFIIPGIIASINYSQTMFVALDNPELSAMEVLKKSKNLMNGHKLDFFILQCSFLGWQILSIFTFGLLSFWLTPYMKVTMANFYNEIKN